MYAYCHVCLGPTSWDTQFKVTQFLVTEVCTSVFLDSSGNFVAGAGDCVMAEVFSGFNQNLGTSVFLLERAAFHGSFLENFQTIATGARADS